MADGFDAIILPHSAQPRVSILISALERPDLLLASLKTLAGNAARHIPFETVVVLNEFEPHVEAELRSKVSGVTFLVSKVNLGVAGSTNFAREHAKGELLVILHDDTEVLTGWLEGLVAGADENPCAGAVGSKVLSMDGSLQGAGSIVWRDGLTSSYWFGDGPLADSLTTSCAVDYCGTSSLLIRATTFDAIGGCDERLYPAYYVDVDLAMAMRDVGQFVLFEPRSVLRHHRGGSSGPKFRHFLASRNRQVFLEKWGQKLESDGHEPYPLEDHDGALRRARERATAFAAACNPMPTPVPIVVLPKAKDPEARERAYRSSARELQQTYQRSLEREVDAVQGQLAGARATLLAVEDERDAAERRSQAALMAIDQIRASTSWRLTAPLRRAARLLIRKT